MKKSKLFAAGGILLALTAFQSCQNCDDAVKAAESSFNKRLTIVSDSLKAEWQRDADAVRAEYDQRISDLETSLNQ